MLNYFFSYLSVDYSFLNVFKYITFRTGVAIFTALGLVLILGGPFIS
ncbi:phospho-N-acetylmuramoyl-pentapeptide-transferase, partial [Pelagibacteraceae bacterium]|nr:phospho-N-acetylmuramoyl-pentapeptide-transferase [Pelagibacteraceae bacterium]